MQRSNSTDSFSTYEKREELRRIVQSKLFAGSPKKTRFLEFVSEQSFQGNSEKLNEYLIGTEVYGRGADFDQQRDPIVRVQAHEIRRLLKRYYEEDGGSSLIRMELPPGHYVPVFTRVGAEIGSEAETVPPTLDAAPVFHRSNRVLVAATIILAALCAALLFQLARRPPAAAPAQTQRAPQL